MLETRPFRFSVGPVNLAMWPAKLPEFARRLEALGYCAVNFGDHPSSRLLPPIAAMTAAAAATTTLRVGTHTLANDYRHPVVLAKEVTTIDQLSGGRVEFGIGAGWLADDYQSCGIDMAPTGRRIERLAESVEIFKRFCGGERFSFSGEHYQISDLEPFPPSVQRPHIPVMIGGGRPRILSLAARVADIVGLNWNLADARLDTTDGPSGTREVTREKVDLIRREAGDRFTEIELCLNVTRVAVSDEPSEIIDELAVTHGLTRHEVRECPHFLIGNTEEIVERLHRNRDEFGISYIAVARDAVNDLAPVVRDLAGS